MEIYLDHRTTKKAVENITKSKNRSEHKDFKNLLPQDKRKFKRVIAKQPLFTRVQILEKSGIEEVKNYKKYRILCELGPVKKNLLGNFVSLKKIS